MKISSNNYNNIINDIRFLNNIHDEIKVMVEYKISNGCLNFVSKINQAVEGLYFLKNHIVNNKNVNCLILETKKFIDFYYNFSWKKEALLKNAKFLEEKCGVLLSELENDQAQV